MFERAIDIAEAKTEDLLKLMKIAGGNPSTFFIGADLKGVDIAGQDLRGINFGSASFAGVIADDATLVDDEFVEALSAGRGADKGTAPS